MGQLYQLYLIFYKILQFHCLLCSKFGALIVYITTHMYMHPYREYNSANIIHFTRQKDALFFSQSFHFAQNQLIKRNEHIYNFLNQNLQ